MVCYRDGGCGPYEMYSCNECPASKPDYKKAKGYPPYLDYPKERKKPSNADKIRQMLDEELARWIARQTTEGGRLIPNEKYEWWLDWLKQEVEE